MFTDLTADDASTLDIDLMTFEERDEVDEALATAAYETVTGLTARPGTIR